MKIKCCNCNKEFEISHVKAMIYSSNQEVDTKCDKCIFDNMFSKLDDSLLNVGISLYDGCGLVKSLEQVLSEVGEKYENSISGQ